ncbi:MAG: alpha-amylase family protein [Clostridia bacterium]|nr:alpha-amylase family protein [Clostridia bacterium]
MKDCWKAEFATRFRRHEDELKWLYSELYHSNEKAYESFTDMLYRCWEERPESLRRLDREREECPGWYRRHDLTGMQMYVDAFAGTLQGVRKKLDYIADCGIGCLHLMPLLESPVDRSDGGYAVSDFRRVQPELGTMEDLRALTEDCHGQGIAVCLDFVMNHTSEDHEWAKRARAGEKEYRDRYFFYDNWEIPNAYEQTVPQVFPATAPGNFTWCPEAGKVVMTTFHPYQWDLNYMNPAVFNDMTDNLLNLCNHGVDLIRLDAVPYIWKALGTTCRNLPQVHTLVRMIRMACETVCPGTLLLGEIVMEPDQVAPYFGTVDKPECHLLYNVTTMATLWHTVATKDARLLAHQTEQLFCLPREFTFLNYLRCHDDIGWGLDYGFLRRFGQEEIPHKKFLNDYLTGKWENSPARSELYNDDPRLGDARLCGTTASLCGVEAARESGDAAAMSKALRLDAMLHAFMFTLSGMPVLYSGDEIARENDNSYHDDPLKQADSRYLHRGRMDWEKAEKRKKKTTAEGRVFAAIRKMEKIRAAHVAFDPEGDTWLLDTRNPHVLCIGRYRLGEQLLALFNFGEEPQTVQLGDGKSYTDLISGKEGDAMAVKVGAGDFRWLLHQF